MISLLTQFVSRFQRASSKGAAHDTIEAQPLRVVTSPALGFRFGAGFRKRNFASPKVPPSGSRLLSGIPEDGKVTKKRRRKSKRTWSGCLRASRRFRPERVSRGQNLCTRPKSERTSTAAFPHRRRFPEALIHH